MNRKCTIRGARVKATSFHPTLGHVALAMHDGTAQIWDYRYNVLVDQYDAHEGSCRTIDYHPNLPMFCTGGDDYMVKVFDYKKKTLMFEMKGHLDYVRSVQFHPTYPWILSASDDQMINIWNWQSRKCIAILTGHNHYVMSARFHATEDLILSASLDATLRVWNITKLKERHNGSAGNAVGPNAFMDALETIGQGTSAAAIVRHSAAQFSRSDDYSVKFVITGHERGVNWAEFHPSLPLIVSGGDDKLVKLWRYTEAKWWEMDTFRGHYSNIEGVLFFPEKDLLISVSEDKSLKIWDYAQRQVQHTERLDHERLWCVSRHPTQNMLAVGHDGGCDIFKLGSNRPVACAPGTPQDSRIFVIINNWLTILDFQEEVISQALVKVEPFQNKSSVFTFGGDSRIKEIYRQLYFNTLNPGGLAFLVIGGEAKSTEADPIILISGDANLGSKLGVYNTQGHGACFISRNRLAILEAPNLIGIYDFSLRQGKKIDLESGYDRMFFGGSGRMLLKQDANLSLYDYTGKRFIGSVHLPSTSIKNIIWNSSYTLCYVIFNNKILCLKVDEKGDGSFSKIFTKSEITKIISGAFDENDVFIYNTAFHTNYILPAEDCGVTQSWTTIIYIYRVSKGTIGYMEQSNQNTIHTSKIEMSEISFKLSVSSGDIDRMAHYVKSGSICGHSIVSYLANKGYPEVALTFIDDTKTRFNLCLSYGNIEEAFNAAETLNDNKYWTRLSEAAILYGKYNLAESCYRKVKDLRGIMELYILTGNKEGILKLKKLLKKHRDQENLFIASLIMGDQDDRILVLQDAGLHGLSQDCKDVTTCISSVAQPVKHDWDLVFKTSSKSRNIKTYEEAMEEQNKMSMEDEVIENEMAFKGFDDINKEFDDVLAALGSDAPTTAGAAEVGKAVYAGDSVNKRFNKRTCPFMVILAGDIKGAVNLLQRNFGVKNLDPFLPTFEEIVISTHCYIPTMPGVPSVRHPLLDADSRLAQRSGYLNPLIPETAQLKSEQALKYYIEKNYEECIAMATKNIVHAITYFDILMTKENVKSTISKMTNLIRASKMLQLIAEKGISTDSVDAVMGVSYLPLSTRAIPGTLSFATAFLIKNKNFQCAAEICNHTIKIFESADLSPPTNIDKILHEAQSRSSDAVPPSIQLPNEWNYCPTSMKLINDGTPTITCPICTTPSIADMKGQVCGACGLGQIGTKVVGF